MATDGHSIKEEARGLSFPRYPGTDGDRRAIEWLQGRMRDAGFQPVIEEFSYDLRPAESALRAVLVVSGLMIGTASMTSSPLLAAAILGAAVVPGLVFLAWSPWIEHLYTRDGTTATANVCCARNVAAPVLTLIVMAHHDSKSQSLGLPSRIALTLVAIAGAVGLFVIVLAVVLSSRPAIDTGFALTVGLPTCAAILALSTLRNHNESPGGVDNAGSVAILLELARRLPDRIPDDVELLFVSTGAEEDHMMGARRWLDLHGEQLTQNPVFCLNLDGAGAFGRPVLIERYGFGRRFSAHMSAASRRAARKLRLAPRGIVMMPGIGIDTIPFAHRGIPSLTLSSGSLGQATMSVHSARDIPDHLNEQTLAEIADLAIETLLDLCEASQG